MFCYQCEQTAKGIACTVKGVCGKDAEVAALQDLLVYALTGLAQVGTIGFAAGVRDKEAEAFMAEGLFSTLTNVNFDPERFVPLIHKAVALREDLKAKLAAAGVDASGLGEAANFTPDQDLNGLIAQGVAHGLEQDPEPNADIRSLKHTVIFGLKGIAAYADHARILGQTRDAVDSFLYEGLAATARMDLSLQDWVGLALKTGEANIAVMEALDSGNTGVYGHPVPTPVPLGAKQGKAILVSGHDLRDLAMLLEQTAGTGVNIYTHGEMLPTHGYPELKKHPHFYGHYGTAWQNQKKEFPAFPGPVLMTTNCIQNPAGYEDKMFTTGLVGWPGVAHIEAGPDGKKDFSAVIEKAKAMPGFPEDTDKGQVLVGFGHNAVLGVAGDVLNLVREGKIRHFFLVAGCDGAKPGRNYYTEFVEKTPADTLVLTLACGKFRFFDKQLGDIGGIPRLLDIGQCNDAYSAVKIAQALAEALGVGINDLPLSMVLSWYEQKAVAILLSLLALGVKNIRLGPTLPAFLSPAVLQVLVDTYDIKPIATADEDLKAILG